MLFVIVDVVGSITFSENIALVQAHVILYGGCICLHCDAGEGPSILFAVVSKFAWVSVDLFRDILFVICIKVEIVVV